MYRFLKFTPTLLLLGATQAYADDSTLAVWVNEAIVSTYTYNHSNFLNRQREIAHYFTAEGWTAYSKALRDSKLPEIIQEHQYYVSSVATLPPEIKNIAKGKWQAVMPLLVLYKNPQYQQKQNLQVTITYGQVPSGQGVRGLAINSLQAKVIEPPCECKLTKTDDKSLPPNAKQ